MKLLAAVTLATGLLAGSAASAQQIYAVQAWINAPGSQANNTADPTRYAVVSANEASATFTWTGPIDWADTSAQNHTSAGGIASDFFSKDGLLPTNFADHATYDTANSVLSESAFLASSLTISGDAYSTFYHITSTYFSAAPVADSFSHDDGASIYVDGVRLPGTTSGETSVVTEGFTLPGGGSHNVDLYYVSGNGTPSILNFSTPGGVPEPASWALMILGFGGVGAILRRSRRPGVLTAA
jgi:hypothetical protein